LSIDARKPSRGGDTAFLGHPAGLGWLSAAEFWERFSYYGMQALLVLYMTNYLLTPEHAGDVLGLPWFQRLLETLYVKELSGAALASATYGFYAGFVYVTPLAGGWLADRFIGRTAAVTMGASLMALGHFLMAFEASLLFALLALLIGVGLFKGNIAAQVGELYADGDARRAAAFQIYYLGIQMAVIISPIICGTLGQTVGWHWGFGAAGVGMVIGLAIYLMGRPTLPAERKRTEQVARQPLTANDRTMIAFLILIVPVLALGIIGNQEIFNAYLIWSEQNLRLEFFGKTMPITWMLSVDAIVSTILMAGMVAFWRWYGRRWSEPNEITKMAIGVATAAFAPVILAVASMITAATGEPVSIAWAVAFHVVNDLGFANVLPVGLALYSRAAPKGFEGTLIAVYYLHLFLGNFITGYLGGLLGEMSGARFWLLHAGLMAIPVVVLFAARYLPLPALRDSYRPAPA
jgi:POT family proton-dependent oligopeptide transporter